MTQNVIGILGPGAVGHLLAYFFHRLPHTVIQMRGRQGRLTSAQPISEGDEITNIPLDQDSQLATLWFCCLKTYHLVDGLRGLLQDLKAGSEVVILSNGYVEPLLYDLRCEYPQIILRKGLVTRGVRLAAEGGYIVGAQGQVIWGDRRPPSAIEQSLLNGLGAQGFVWSEETCRLRREKWFYNTCLNTMCGVYRLQRNSLALSDHRDELEALASEVLALAQELWLDWQPVQKDLWKNLLGLIARTADNENSMAADVRLGRQTEASALSGMVYSAKDPQRYGLLLAFDQKLRV